MYKRQQKNIPTTAQQSIPYIRMLQDGICQVTKTFFSKTIQFYDINYQLALNEDKTTIFENYCDFLNYFDSSISVQLSFINQQVDVAEFEKSIDIPDQNDDFNAIREEYRTCLLYTSLLYYQVFVGMLEININSAEVLYKQKEKTINE